MLMEIAVFSGLAAYLRQRRERNKPLVQRLSLPAVPAGQAAPTAFSGKRLLHDLKVALLGDERQQQQLSLNAEEAANLENFKQQANRNMLLSAGATGLALLGAFSPVFWLLGAGAVLYLSRDVFQFIWRDIRRKHYFSVYWFGAVMVLGMIASGHLVLAAFSGVVGGFLLRIVKRVEDSAQAQLAQVFAWHPAHVWVLQDGTELQIPFAELQQGDTVIVNAGEVIPVDGVILDGMGTIDQHVLTGESQPVERASGEPVFASTLLLGGRLTVRVETAAEDTLAANIAQVLNNTQSYKDNLMARGQQIADRFIPVEAGLGALTLAVAGPTPALAMLWSGLGANMAILGPLSVLNYLHILSRQGILIKDGRVFESLRQVDTVVFDKTGTLTLEQPEVGQIHALADDDVPTLLRYAAAAEYRQPHPVAKAILAKADSLGLELPSVAEASYAVGYGIQVMTEGHLVQVGSERFMQQQQLAIPEPVAPLQAQAAAQGYSLIYVAIDQRVAGVLEIRPSIRPEAAAIVRTLKQRGLKLYIISGDHQQPTQHLAQALGIDHYFAEVLPENKAALVQQLRDDGRFVCFIGDGINDAIALKAAQVSVSLKGASSVATDTAQIVFMDGTLERLPTLLNLSAEFEQTMQANLVSSFAPGILNIAGIVFLHTGIAAGMALFYLGAVAGLGVSLRPLVRHQQTLAELPEPVTH